jgi:Uma2 family endonuclease
LARGLTEIVRLAAACTDATPRQCNCPEDCVPKFNLGTTSGTEGWNVEKRQEPFRILASRTRDEGRGRASRSVRRESLSTRLTTWTDGRRLRELIVSRALHTEDVYVSVEDYLSAESASPTKHEYLAGAVYAMAGGSRAHNLITANLLRFLGVQLDGRKCAVFGSDMRLRISRPNAAFYYYPDVTVDCSASEQDEVDEPTVIFEVLSPTTARADQGEKLLNYQAIPSMRVYVLVDQSQAALTVYRRAAQGHWTLEIATDLAGLLELPEIGCTLPLRSIYDRVFSAV